MSQSIKRNSEQFLYQQVIDMVLEMKNNATIRPGDKLPSLRKMSLQLSLSIPTIKMAYTELERQGMVIAKEKSGYFLKAEQHLLPLSKKTTLSHQPKWVKKQGLIEQVYEAIHAPDMVSMGIANPTTIKPADKALARVMRQVLSKAGAKAISYAPTTGYPPLKRQLALRYFEQGLQLNPEEIIITNGAQEALSIALQCVAQKGDVIAVESPAFFGVLELIESLGMMALELPMCPDEGICSIDIKTAINNQPIKACLLSTTISNPLGSFMPEKTKKEVVKLLEANDIPLIEDDVYGDLHFTRERGRPAHCYSSKGLVLTCSSFSKTAAPGYRVGWLIPGKFSDQATCLKRATSCSTGLLNQWTLAEYIAGSEYDKHIRNLRIALKQNRDRMISLVQQKFPSGTKISRPQGGCVLWIELPNKIDSEQLFAKAIEKQISIAPGSIFAARKKFKHFIRLSYGMPWTEPLESAIDNLGQMLHQWKNE